MSSSSLRTSAAEQSKVLSPSAKKAKKAKLAAALDTVNKLNFDSVGLVGRDDETAELEKCLKRLVSDETKGNTKRELVLISGESGTGKTTLASTLKDSVKRIQGVFVRGKYDIRFRDNQPFSGISVACNEMCRYLLSQQNNDTELMSSIRQDLFEQIDNSKIELLETVVPLLHIVAYGLDNKGKDDNKSISREFVLDITEQQPQKKHRKSFLYKRAKRRRSSVKRHNRDTSAKDSRSFFKDSRSLKIKDTLSSIGGGRVTGIDPKIAKAMLILSFTRLFRILAARLKAVVILLDDLQWADSSSLDLIEAILEDQEKANLMIIGCYRSDEVDADHAFFKTVQNIKGKQVTSGRFNMCEMPLGNLPFDAVDFYIRELLSVSSPEKGQNLASICHKRTLGNIFFIKVFLTSLHGAGLLTFNIGGFQWMWDEKRIEAETAATDNLINLLISKMNSFSEDMLLLLELSSCLGSMFEKSTLVLLWGYFYKRGIEESKQDSLESIQDSLEKILKVAVDEMFFEVVNESTYRFVHDKVQEAASLLISEDEYITFQKNIGMFLFQELDADELERMIFVVTDLLNSHNEKNIEVALLNLQAATKSMELSAFLSAKKYVECGIQRLDESTMWDECYHLAMELHMLGVQTEKCIGDKETLEWYCSQVLKQKNVTLLNKMKVQQAWIERLGPGELQKAIPMCLKLFREMGYHYPKSHIFQHLKAKWRMKETRKHYIVSSDEIAEMPFVSDPLIAETVSLFSFALMPLNMRNERKLHDLVCCDCVRLTKEHGLTDRTGSILMSFANVLMHQNGDWSTAAAMAEMALALESRVDSNYSRSITLMKENMIVLGWTKPLKGVWGGFMESYRLAMISGNLICVSLAIFGAIACQLFSGTPLDVVEGDFHTYIPQLEALQQNFTVLYLPLFWQIVIHLKEGASLPKRFEMDIERLKSRDGTDLGDLHPGLPLYGRHAFCYICMHLGEYDKGAEIALSLNNKLYELRLGFALWGFYTFPLGMCLYAAAAASSSSQKTAKTKENNNKRYISAARKFRQIFRQWVKNGAVNSVHQLYMLEAEDAMIHGKKLQIIKSNYSKAIVTASRSGFVQDAGLANERYGSYLVSQNHVSDALFYYKESLRCYSEWGATRKVEQLREKMRSLGINS